MSDQVPYLTTLDNPFDPSTEFQEWYAFDRLMGYNTVELLARRTFTSPNISPADQEDSRVFAIEEIVEENVSGMHTIVYGPSE